MKKYKTRVSVSIPGGQKYIDSLCKQRAHERAVKRATAKAKKFKREQKARLKKSQ